MSTTSRARLSPSKITDELAALPGWTLERGKLTKKFVFADFSEAWGWMSRVALEAERMGHHPEWLNVYRTVRVHLQTHDSGGITDLDIDMARRMNGLVCD